MKSRKLKALESRLLDTLRERFADPEAEAPTTLRDQPTEVVFTALQPKKPSEDRVGAMGFGALPEIPQDDFDPSLYADPVTTGEQTVQALLGGQDQQQQVQAAPQIQPPEPTREEMQVLQAQQQGQGGGQQQDPRQAIMAALQGAGGGGGQAQPQSRQGGAQQAQRRSRQEESMQDLLVRG